MVKTISLNSDNSVYVSTYWGGKGKGRSYVFTVNVNGIQTSCNLTDKQLLGMMVLNGGKSVKDDGVRPIFD